ncbi:hypothetical protein [Colwellia sp. UCD-KL20]|uniref:hypothetical protein n=1 Tax=Colwellia sp. UCD-KL20 TaxID=1917165 RepID=UPI0011785B16|nr:hypothetical protein [Colwellia sp. UCD-KL20]
MKIKKLSAIILSTCFISHNAMSEQQTPPNISSIETGRTITKIRTGSFVSGQAIITSSYEGVVAAYDFSGQSLWTNTLSGYMNHDVWVDDLNGDGIDEILTANADGKVYCLNADGSVKWSFGLNEVPMNSVTVVQGNGTTYIAAGGYDKNLYYLATDGTLLKTIASSTYSRDKVFGTGVLPTTNTHTVNHLRPVKLADGSEKLVLLGTNNSLQTAGSYYVFEPFANTPDSKTKVHIKKGIGDMRAVDFDGDGNQELVIGNSAAIGDAAISVFNPIDLSFKNSSINDIASKIDRFGYRVAQTEVIMNQGEKTYVTLFGSRLLLTPESFDVNESTILANKYSYYDLWKDDESGKLLLASAQSGGSQIHIIDPSQTGWQEKYSSLEPGGKLAKIQANTQKISQQLASFNKPLYERSPLPVYFISENRKEVGSIIENIESNYASPIFLNSTSLSKVENWDRSVELADNPEYRDKRDGRKKYTLTSQEMFDTLAPKYQNSTGIAQWAGHGNDPYMISLPTLKNIITAGEGKKNVNIYPEVEGRGEAFEKVLSHLFFPLSEFSAENNANIFMRNKHTFWQSSVYLPEWQELRSGNHADVFVPAMEETTDKSMEVSLAGRMGFWMSGAVNDWGERYARDNPSFDRLRQHSHQMVPNHALRQTIYKVASGARYINNFSFNQEYMSLAWELIAKGALYVPKRNELLNISPVHLSMKEPDPYYLESSNNVKWTTFYDAALDNEPYVFNRLSGTWPGAKNVDWDYSLYAADTKDRRLDFIPKFPQGVVMITPVQQGVYKDRGTIRGALTDHMHPIYKDNTKEFITDGKNYITPNGQTVVAANSNRVDQIKNQLRLKSELLPMTVSGGTAWVVAQSAPKNLRLTLVDSGYLNPEDRIAHVKFNAVTPVKITDLLSGESFVTNTDGVAEIPVDAGSFRFIDVEISEAIGDFPAISDSISLTESVTTLENTSSYTFNFAYQALEELRTVNVSLLKNNIEIASTSQTVTKGASSTAITLNLTDLPESGNDYSLQYSISVEGEEPTEIHTIENVSIAEPAIPVDALYNISFEAIVDPSIPVPVQVELDITEPRDVYFDLRKKSDFSKADLYKVTVSEPGSITINVPVAESVESGEYRWSVYITPVGGKFKDRVSDSIKKFVTFERAAQQLTGDLDENGQVDRLDLRTLQMRVRAGSTDLTYDINNNGSVERGDISTLMSFCSKPRCAE